MTEEEFNHTLKELDCILYDVDYDKFETPLDVAKFVITLNKINERMILEENEELKAQILGLKNNLDGHKARKNHYMKECEELKDLLNRSNIRLAEEQIKNEELKKSVTEKNSEVEELKAKLKKINEIMSIDTYCENIYHFLSCELGMNIADEYDCEVCRYTGCSKRLKPCELE